MRSHLCNSAKDLRMRRRLLERVQRADRAERAASVGRAFAQKFAESARCQVLDRRQIRRQILGRNVVKHDVQRLIRLDRPCDQVQRAPLAFQRLESGW